MEHLAGGAVAIVGILFSGSGVLGKSRLERWEHILNREGTFRRWLVSEGDKIFSILRRPFDSGLTNRYGKLGATIKWSFMGLFLVMALGLIAGFLAAFGSKIGLLSDRQASALVTPFAWAMFIALPIFLAAYLISYTGAVLALFGSRLVSVACRLLLVPYRLVRWIEQTGALERTFILLGTALAIVGFLLCTWTPY